MKNNSKNTISDKSQAPQFLENAVSGSVSQLTENKFRQFFSEFGNASEGWENSMKVVFYTLNRNIDNNFNLSYHLKFPKKNVQFNFWFDKICYLNSKESVTISFFNGNEPKEQFRLKSILTTSDLNILKEKVNDLFIDYR